MIITVIRVRVVEASVDEVIGVLTVRHSLVAAVRAMHVLTAIVLAVAVGWEPGIDRQRALLNAVALRPGPGGARE